MIKQIKAPGDMPRDAEFMVIVIQHKKRCEEQYDDTGHLISRWAPMCPDSQITTASTWEEVEGLLRQLYKDQPNRKDILVLQGAMPLEIVTRLNFVVQL